MPERIDNPFNLPELPYRVTRKVKKKEPGNYGPRTFQPGEILYKFRGVTYGCVNYSEGLPMSLTSSFEYPFFQFPLDALEEVTDA